MNLILSGCGIVLCVTVLIGYVYSWVEDAYRYAPTPPEEIPPKWVAYPDTGDAPWRLEYVPGEFFASPEPLTEKEARALEEILRDAEYYDLRPIYGRAVLCEPAVGDEFWLEARIPHYLPFFRFSVNGRLLNGVLPDEKQEKLCAVLLPVIRRIIFKPTKAWESAEGRWLLSEFFLQREEIERSYRKEREEP